MTITFLIIGECDLNIACYLVTHGTISWQWWLWTQTHKYKLIFKLLSICVAWFNSLHIEFNLSHFFFFAETSVFKIILLFQIPFFEALPTRNHSAFLGNTYLFHPRSLISCKSIWSRATLSWVQSSHSWSSLKHSICIQGLNMSHKSVLRSEENAV